MNLESPYMNKNNKGIAPIYIGVIVLVIISTALGIYYYVQSQEKKANIAKIERLDEELADLIDVNNFVTVSNGEAIPGTQSKINSTLDDIEDNLKEFEKTLQLIVKDNSDISCSIDRNTLVKSRFVDDTRRILLGSGSTSSQYNKTYWYKNFEDNKTQWQSNFKRGCKDLYKNNGIEFND